MRICMLLGLLVAGMALSGCGLVRSVFSSEVEETRTERTEVVRYLDEFEGFSANIPVGMVEAVELPSGLRVVLKDSVELGVLSDELRGDGGPGTDSATLAGPDSSRDSARSLGEGWIALDWRRGVVERDSSVVDVEVERSERLERETEVSTGSGFVWLFVGIAVALGLVVAGFLFFRR